MATLIDWSQVETKVTAYAEQFDYETKSLALNHILLEYLFYLSPEEIGDAITDGSQDRGVDAVHIETQGSKRIFHLFQIKHVESFEKSNNNFPSSEIDKLLSFINDVLRKDTSLKGYCNTLLWGKVQEIWEAFNQGTPSFIIHFAGNLDSLTTSEQNRIRDSLAPFRNFSVEHHTLESIANLIIESKAPKIDRGIRLVDDQYFERVDGNIRGLVATVQASDLVGLIRDPDKSDTVNTAVFDDNVRIYLTSQNRINGKIIESALSEHNAEFWYLNNGITLICDSMEYPPKTRAPWLEMKNVQIVNGGQTSNALFEAYLANPERLSNALILIRVYETKRREMGLKIAETTNSQTPIRSRDLRSNDEVQRKIEDSFLSMGYFYERKAGQHKTEDKRKRIDALTAGQAYIAYHLELPDVAGKDRGKVFGELYDEIFNDDITAQKLLLPLQVFRPIEQMKLELQKAIRVGTEYDPRHLFLIDGAYHLLYTIAHLCALRKLDESDLTTALNQLNDAIKIIQSAVTIESTTDPAFAYKRFFKSTRAKRYIQQEASEYVERTNTA